MGSSVLFGFSSDQTFGLITFRPPELMKGEVSSPSYSGADPPRGRSRGRPPPSRRIPEAGAPLQPRSRASRRLVRPRVTAVRARRCPLPASPTPATCCPWPAFAPVTRCFSGVCSGVSPSRSETLLWVHSDRYFFCQ
ncbi:hypothetical protein M6B38_326215 [Iris pallida]|uniref:Uncharacterized protein n=1 Tax=Iris pallida TaxID=29817 RepID=A0AAX6H7J9_IRIPA|nr:hypothetical protein M6B38_326215 [Iris pallida]